MTGRKLRAFLEHAYMLAVGLFLLWNIPYMTEAGWTFALREIFPALWLGLAAAALVLQRMKPGIGGCLLALTAWMTVASVYRGANVLEAQWPMILRGVMAFGVILPAPRIVRWERLLGYVKGILMVWTACLTMQAALGLWAALSGHAVFSLKGTWYIGVNLGDNRLYLGAYVTTGAVKMGLSVLLSMVGFGISRKVTSKISYALCALIQLACLSLTDCRTAFLTVGFGLGLGAAMALLHGPSGEKRKWWRRMAALAAIPVMILAAYGALSGLLTALAPHVPHELDNLTLLEIPAHLLPEAAAESAREALQHREITASNLFNGRQVIWRAALRLLSHEPKYLLTGVTTALSPVMTNVYVLPGEYTGQMFAHVHSIYLQTLVSWGLPGLALLAVFLGAFLLAAWRVMARHDLPLWQRWVPVPVLYVLLCETVDCFTRLSEESPLLLFGCLFAGLTLAIDQRARRAALAEKPAAEPVDVIIPVYNAEKYVARAAESALKTPGVRVILVDDGSTDGSSELCDRLAADPRIMALHQENRGASAARNAGLLAATADVVTFLDADDVLLPGALAQLLARMGEADAIQGRILRKDPETIPGCTTETLPAREALSRALSNPTRHLLCHGWLFRRKALKERFDESLTLGEDGEWLLRTMTTMKTVAFCDLPTYRYTLRADSALRGGDGVMEAYLRTLAAAAPALETLEMPQAAALYRLTHLLLILTHGGETQAAALRETEPFSQAFREARLRGMSPRMTTLRLLRARRYRLVHRAVRLRRSMNRSREEKSQ